MKKYNHESGRTQGERYQLMMLEELEEINSNIKELLKNFHEQRVDKLPEVISSDLPKEPNPVQKKPRKKKTDK